MNRDPLSDREQDFGNFGLFSEILSQIWPISLPKEAQKDLRPVYDSTPMPILDI